MNVLIVALIWLGVGAVCGVITIFITNAIDRKLKQSGEPFGIPPDFASSLIIVVIGAIVAPLTVLFMLGMAWVLLVTHRRLNRLRRTGVLPPKRRG